jgi:hypothetical protein
MAHHAHDPIPVRTVEESYPDALSRALRRASCAAYKDGVCMLLPSTPSNSTFCKDTVQNHGAPTSVSAQCIGWGSMQRVCTYQPFLSFAHRDKV